MTLQDYGSIGEAVGAIATIATLVYLALQIRASTAAARSVAAQSVHEAYATWYRLIASDETLAAIITNGLRDYDSLTEQERTRFIAVFMAYLSGSQDAFIKWREGTLAPELWVGWELALMNLVIPPGGRRFWADRSYLFGESFRDHVETVVMEREPHPSAKPMGAFTIGNRL